MRAHDLPICEAIGEAVHVAHPEDDGRMAEKFRLFPTGCLVLRRGGTVLGYAVAYPGLAGTALPLNAPVGRLPDGADTLYLHDLALLPAARGAGAGLTVVERLTALAQSRGIKTVSIVAVGGTAGFWQRAGFRTIVIPALDPVLRTYDPGARYMERPVQGAGRVASSADCSM